MRSEESVSIYNEVCYYTSSIFILSLVSYLKSLCVYQSARETAEDTI